MKFLISKVGILNIEIEERNSVLRNTCMIFNWVMKKQGCKDRQWSVQEGPGIHNENITFYAMGNGGMLLDLG